MDDKDFEKLVFGMAHQIRNPCAIIKANANVILEQENLSPESRRSMESIWNGVKYLEARLDEFVEFSKPVILKPEPFPLKAFINQSCAVFKEQCQLKRTKISCNVEKDIVLGKADPNQLALALLNVVLNAVESIKEEGTIILEGKSDGNNAVITVSDTGSGIHPRDLPEVFSPFYSTKPNSIGIGLGVARRIIQAHQGRIGIESSLGHGTVVTIVLPLNPR